MRLVRSRQKARGPELRSQGLDIIRGVVFTRELVVDIKLRRGMMPLLTVVVEYALALIVGNINAMQSVEHSCHSLLCDVICIGTLVELDQITVQACR